MADKLKFAFYWNASCGGCEIAVLDINEKILDVAALADIVLWPVALDFKYHHVQALPDNSIDVSFINGSIRNSEQKEIVELLRQKSKVVVAFGSCAHLGGIPALANLRSRAEIFERAYRETPSTVNPENVLPQPRTRVAEGELELPVFFDHVYRLDEVIPVEYYVPGCPPTPKMIVEAVTAIAEGKLPPVGSVFGGTTTVCDSCRRTKEEKKVKAFHRIHEVEADPERCFLEQGIICAGPATRDGCGTLCLNANMPCRGCFGPPDGVADQGARLLSALATLVDSKDLDEIQGLIDQVVDPAGYFYRFGMSSSLLKHKVLRPEEAGAQQAETKAQVAAAGQEGRGAR
ncbi:NAD-reducing hydrogenase HoxS subunit delta [Peptococcaceae bacterium CEB3]|nr:NAD-reducing hydrogenase HoxS subunit delta [Peptococcaceae bacterium CEB3]